MFKYPLELNYVYTPACHTADGRVAFMHEVILPPTPEKPYVMHINGDKFDNQCHNLQLCTEGHFKRVTDYEMYRLRGRHRIIRRDPRSRKFIVRIRALEEELVGVFNSRIEAEKAYLEKAIAYADVGVDTTYLFSELYN